MEPANEPALGGEAGLSFADGLLGVSFAAIMLHAGNLWRPIRSWSVQRDELFVKFRTYVLECMCM